MSVIITQGVGFLGMACFVLSYQLKSNWALYLCHLLGSGLFCLQYVLLGAPSGCWSLALYMVQTAMLLKVNAWAWVRWKGWVAVFAALFGAIAAFTWEGPESLLVLAASVASTVGYWSNNARIIRLTNLVCIAPCWLIYDVIAGTWGGVLNEIITVVSILVSVARFGWKALDGDFDT